jgi:hypothetical protein
LSLPTDFSLPLKELGRRSSWARWPLARGGADVGLTTSLFSRHGVVAPAWGGDMIP